MSKRLVTPNDVRRYLARVINDLEQGKIKPEIAGRLGYLANILVRTMEVSFQQNVVLALQQKILAIEERIGL